MSLTDEQAVVEPIDTEGFEMEVLRGLHRHAGTRLRTDHARAAGADVACSRKLKNSKPLACNRPRNAAARCAVEFLICEVILRPSSPLRARSVIKLSSVVTSPSTDGELRPVAVSSVRSSRLDGTVALRRPVQATQEDLR